MNAATSILLFLLGCGGLALLLFTNLRRNSYAGELGVVCALLMLLPTAEAESPLVRWVLGGLCFVLLLVLLGGWLSVTPKGSRGSKRCKRR